MHPKTKFFLFILFCSLLASAVVLPASGITITRQLAHLEVVQGASIRILSEYFEYEGVNAPEGLIVRILPGEQYSFSSDTLFPDHDFSGELLVNIQLEQGTAVSNIFRLSVYVIKEWKMITFFNGSFEEGDASKWSFRKELPATIVSSDTAASEVCHGNYALKIMYDGIGFLRTSGTTYFDVIQGKTYEMVFYAKGLNEGSEIFAAMTSGSNEPVNGHKEKFTLSNQWKRYSYSLTSPITGTFGCRFEFLTPDTFWLDNVFLIEEQEVSPPKFYRDRYVSSGSGDDVNDGSEASPFRTIRKALENIGPGEMVILREGSYHEENLIEVHATGSSPVVIRGYPGEEAILDGSVEVDGIWEHHEGNIWKLKISHPEVLNYGAHQVWLDGKMLKVARWPNYSGTFADDFNFEYTAREPEPGTNWDLSTSFVSLENDFSQVSPDSDSAIWKSEGTGIQSLGGTGINFTGAMVALKMGYETVLEEIISHTAGEDIFISSSTEGNNRNELLTLGKQYFFILAHMSCLDDANEWYYNPSDHYIYVYTPDGNSPENEKLRMKTQNLALQVRNSSNVIIDGLTFFATHFKVENSTDIQIRNCVLNYPSYFPAMLKTRTLSYSPHIMTNSSVNVFNCELRYFDGTGLNFDGSNTYTPVLENTLLHNGRFNHMVNFFKCKGAYAAYNTLYVSERGNGIKYFKSPYGHFVAEYNYFHNLATHRSDASCIQVQSGSQNYDTLRYNWFHDTENKGIRFDGEPAGKLGTLYANVGWEMWQGLQVKGDSQNVVNNTFFNCSKRCDITVLSDERFGGNEAAIVFNNAAERMSGHRVRDVQDYPLPGTVGNNWNGFITGKDISTVLRDPANLDFRPRDESCLVDGGANLEPFITRWNGDSRDIGAYESGDSIYWIPGRKSRKASMPVPPNASATALSNCNLMWRPALGAKKHRVYLGNSISQLNLVSEQMSNIFDPGELDPNQLYFWRIDEVVDNEVIRGDIWHFVPHGTRKSDNELPVTYFENFNKSDDDANFEPWDENIWDPSTMTQDSTWVVNDSLVIWPSAERTLYANYYTLKGIDMILRPHPLIKFSYSIPRKYHSFVFGVNVTSEGKKGEMVRFEVPIRSSKGEIFVNIAQVFDRWEETNPDQQWNYLEDFDICFYPEKDFDGTEKILIDDFKLGFGCLLDQEYTIEITGQDTIITQLGAPFYLSVDNLQLSLTSVSFPGDVFPVSNPYKLPGYPKVIVLDSDKIENVNNVITPTEEGINPIAFPIQVLSGNIHSSIYDFMVYIGEFIDSRTEPGNVQLTAYPNPFSEGVFIKGYQHLENINIYDTSGILVKSLTDCNGYIEMSDQNSGMYIMEVYTDQGLRYFQKIIKR